VDNNPPEVRCKCGQPRESGQTPWVKTQVGREPKIPISCRHNIIDSQKGP